MPSQDQVPALEVAVREPLRRARRGAGDGVEGREHDVAFRSGSGAAEQGLQTARRKSLRLHTEQRRVEPAPERGHATARVGESLQARHERARFFVERAPQRCVGRLQQLRERGVAEILEQVEAARGVATETSRHRQSVRLEKRAQRFERGLGQHARRRLAAVGARDQRGRLAAAKRHAVEAAVREAAACEPLDARDVAAGARAHERTQFVFDAVEGVARAHDDLSRTASDTRRWPRRSRRCRRRGTRAARDGRRARAPRRDRA